MEQNAAPDCQLRNSVRVWSHTFSVWNSHVFICLEQEVHMYSHTAS